MSTKRSTISLL